MFRFPRAETNPNISGKDSTSSNASFGSEGSSDSSEDSDVEGGVQLSASSDEDDSSENTGNYLSFKVACFFILSDFMFTGCDLPFMTKHVQAFFFFF